MNRLFNYAFYAIFIFFLIQKVPGVYKNFILENKPVEKSTVQLLSGEQYSFPIQNQKMILVFWATWCEPCKIELNRINKLFLNGKIKPQQFLAINIQENKETISQFLQNNQWNFPIALDETGKISDKYKVTGTPTVVFLDENSNIEWITTGLSPLLEFRIEKFLK